MSDNLRSYTASAQSDDPCPMFKSAVQHPAERSIVFLTARTTTRITSDNHDEDFGLPPKTGHCSTKNSVKDVLITLSEKVCDTPERCRDTLIHELCHAAVFLIDNVFAHNHGVLWQNWTKLVAKIYPTLPKIKVTHTYKVFYKYIYRCTNCKYEVSRHTKSLNIDSDHCGRCMSKFELLMNVKSRKLNVSSNGEKNFHKFKQSNPQLSTPLLMKQLSEAYKASPKNINKNPNDENNGLVSTTLNFEKLQIY
ncbi:unnamed protein product [Didymodactylos carnosus]|uniref:SprT-like domain-containing protein n=1 Tax=Didymodactylos carnosus TaxID=1234261 RepID=A0A814EUZ9_9BILA|nr:unnamed protein product [Didymodactylos carnosus]CAF3745426.1 unnamed protein product [Didymodactylos carnosus]